MVRLVDPMLYLPFFFQLQLSVKVYVDFFLLDSENDPNAAGRCDYSNCTLPNCFCSVDGTLIPGNLEPNQVVEKELDQMEELMGKSIEDSDICPRSKIEIRNNINNIGIDQKALTVSGETEDYVIAALAVAFPERDCFSIVSLSWK